MTSLDKIPFDNPSNDPSSQSEEAANKIRKDLEAMLGKAASKGQKPAEPGKAVDPSTDAGKD